MIWSKCCRFCLSLFSFSTVLLVLLPAVVRAEKEETTLPLNPLSREVSSLSCRLSPDGKNLLLLLDTGDTGVGDSRLKADGQVSATKGGWERTVPLNFRLGRGTGVLPVPPPGQYEVSGTLFVDGGKFFTLQTTLEVLGNGTVTPEEPFQALCKSSSIGLDIDPDVGLVVVRVRFNGSGIGAERLQGECGLVGRGMSLNGNTRPLKISDGTGECVISLPAPPVPGEYEVIVRLTFDRKDSFELRKKLVVPATEWLGNTLGLEDKVLPPWIPLTRQDDRISCWGREYHFAAGGLPRKILSAGEELLAGPVTFQASKDGQVLAPRLEPFRIDSFSPTRMEASSKMTLGDKAFLLKISAEYDGLLLFDMSQEQPGEFPLDALSLLIPVRQEHALYQNLFDIGNNPFPGNVPPGEGVVHTRQWTPFAWLGDNDRGLFWFCESDEMWPNREGNTLEVVRTGNEVALRFNILTAGQKAPPDWKLTFGLQATPVKKINPREFRRMRFWGPTENINLAWPAGKKPWSTKGFGFPEAAQPEAYAEYIRDMQKRGMMVTPYVGITFVTDGLPETVFFKKYWYMGFDDPSISKSGNWEHNWYCADPAGKGFADFLVWKTKDFMERYNLDGIYHDQSHPYVAHRPGAGSGYSYRVLAHRNLYRRTYAVVKSLPRKTFMLAHMSAKMNIPVLAYEDAFLEGEWPFAPLVRTKSYMEILTMDNFRAGFMGRQWGLAPFFLPELRDEKERAIEPTRELLGLLMVHDVAVMRLFCNRNILDNTHRALDEFGYVDADFIPYFDPVPLATTDMPEVYISAYKHDNGSVLLIAANLSKEKKDRTGKIKINAGSLCIQTDKLMSWPDRSPVPLQNDEIEVTVPSMDFRMFVLGTPISPPPVIVTPFSGWLISNLEMRREAAKYLRPEADRVILTTKEKPLDFFAEKPLPAKDGNQVTITCKVYGRGTAGCGFFAYTGTGWNQVSGGSVIKPLILKPEAQTIRLVIPVKGEKISDLRPVFRLEKDSEMTVSDFQMTVE